MKRYEVTLVAEAMITVRVTASHPEQAESMAADKAQNILDGIAKNHRNVYGQNSDLNFDSLDFWISAEEVTND